MRAKGQPLAARVDRNARDLLLADAQLVDRVEVRHLPQAKDAVGESNDQERAVCVEVGADGLGSRLHKVVLGGDAPSRKPDGVVRLLGRAAVLGALGRVPGLFVVFAHFVVLVLALLSLPGEAGAVARHRVDRLFVLGEVGADDSIAVASERLGAESFHLVERVQTRGHVLRGSDEESVTARKHHSILGHSLVDVGKQVASSIVGSYRPRAQDARSRGVANQVEDRQSVADGRVDRVAVGREHDIAALVDGAAQVGELERRLHREDAGARMSRLAPAADAGCAQTQALAARECIQSTKSRLASSAPRNAPATDPSASSPFILRSSFSEARAADPHPSR
ncbi:hypothetical protein L1887_49072 [Cichorium endivia]|nr:hypothetical protein L1887_49072 [Cichorium endivia]